MLRPCCSRPPRTNEKACFADQFPPSLSPIFFLTGTFDKPYPSLTQCYKYNGAPGSCCVSAHDEQIHAQYASHFSSTCLREYPEFEFYYCIGCNPDEQDFTDPASKKIRVCKPYAVSKHVRFFLAGETHFFFSSNAQRCIGTATTLDPHSLRGCSAVFSFTAYTRN